jgi:hypothetical protein
VVFGNLSQSLGSTGNAYHLAQVNADQYLGFAGGNTISSGATLLLYGNAHATLAKDFALRDNTANVIYYDSSANTIALAPTAGTTTLLLESAYLTYGRSATGWQIRNAVDDQYVILWAGNTANTGANLLMYGNTAAAGAGDIRLRDGSSDVLVYDRSGNVINLYPTAGTAAAQFTSTQGVWGTSAASFTHRHVVDTQSVNYSGGSGSTTGANLNLFGSANGAAGGDFYLRTGSTIVIGYDHSATKLTLTAASGVEVSGDLLVYNSAPLVTIKDNASAHPNANPYVQYLDNADTLLGMVGFASGSTGDLYVYQEQNNDIQFHTNAALKMTLTAGGTLDVSSPGGGVKLDNLASSDANTLDDYEEGTWTPVLTDGVTNATHSVQVGTYTKVGRMVHVKARVTTTSVTTAGLTGSVWLSGLPFTSANVTDTTGTGSVGFAGGLNITASENLTSRVGANSSTMSLSIWNANAGVGTLQASEWSDDGDIIVDATYYV